MVTLKDGKIIDSLATLLEQCQGEKEGLLRGVENNLGQFQAPGVSWSRETVAPGWLKGLFGKKRDFLIVTHERFDDYTFFVSARDYGTALDISWYLAGSTSRSGERSMRNRSYSSISRVWHPRACSFSGRCCSRSSSLT